MEPDLLPNQTREPSRSGKSDCSWTFIWKSRSSISGKRSTGISKVLRHPLRACIILSSETSQDRPFDQLSRKAPCWLANLGLKDGGVARQTHPLRSSSPLRVLTAAKDSTTNLYHSSLSLTKASLGVTQLSRSRGFAVSPRWIPVRPS